MNNRNRDLYPKIGFTQSAVKLDIGDWRRKSQQPFCINANEPGMKADPLEQRRLDIGGAEKDLAVHGGEQPAVFVCQSIAVGIGRTNWDDDFAYRQFGENFIVDNLSDAELCMGDCYRIGEALFEVTRPCVTVRAFA